MQNFTLRLLLLCIIASGITNANAQTSPYGYAQTVDSLLQSIDKMAITTGLLYDRAADSLGALIAFWFCRKKFIKF